MTLEASERTAAPDAVIQAASEFTGIPVAGALWLIGRSLDGLCFVAEKWGDGGGWVSWKSSFTECLEDIRNRIETDDPLTPGIAPVEEDAVALLVDAMRALIYERDMAGCWRKDRADDELRKIQDVLDTYFGGYEYPPNDEDEATPPAVADAGRKIPISELVGIAPDLTGGLPSDVWLDQMRGAPAVADAGETEENDDSGDDEPLYVSGAPLSVRTFVCVQPESLAALRRDVKMQGDQQDQGFAGLITWQLGILERLERLESRERPDSNLIVTDAMAAEAIDDQEG